MADAHSHIDRRFRIRGGLALAAAGTALAAAPAASQAQVTAPQIKSVRCYSSCVSKRTVVAGGRIEIRGTRLASGMRAVFPVTAGGVVAARSIKTRVTKTGSLIARVPRDARSGRLFVQVPGGERSNDAKLRVARGAASGSPPPGTSPFEGNGMWIWYVNKSNGGNLASIVSTAKAHGITTVFVKSGDGTNYWSQFSSKLVSTLKAGGLRVCAWQYVYGNNPSGEAAAAVKAVKTGAECFVIDAESQYEGKYSQAQTYVTRLRSGAGPSYPIGLAGFPYVDYHPAFPYSVFFGPSGAQYNVPQVYWKEIGGGVDTVVGHTYRFNRPYGRPIYPLGQLYNSPPTSDIKRFRQMAAAEGSTGLSWWDWQESTSRTWGAVGAQIDPFPGTPSRDYAVFGKGARGDLVLWAQQHLRAAGQAPPVDGSFGSSTQQAVSSFQASSGLPATGKIDTATWDALLRYAPAAKAKAGVRAASNGGTNGPPTARLPAKRNEIRPPAQR
ncbi:MAG: hypothetical protein QOK25_1908 [Thermoleophilaceae bacterium]|jgi:hypothetical protein|nr:hypothetical protein [Thermoleophilaceae bacterium]